MKIKKETIKRTIFLLIVLIAFSILAQQAEAINTFYTTQSSNATFETAQAESDLRSGLVGHWSFNTADKSNATNATDKSGMQNHGTVSGATFTNEGRFKEGDKFDGGKMSVAGK